jgi:hypothetical protein
MSKASNQSGILQQEARPFNDPVLFVCVFVKKVNSFVVYYNFFLVFVQMQHKQPQFTNKPKVKCVPLSMH